MRFPDLRSFLAELEAAGELVRVSQELSARHEAATAIKMVEKKQGKAVLMDNIKGYDVPVVGNLMGSAKRLAIALGVDEKDLPATYLERRNKPVKPKMVTEAPVQEVVIDSEVDISKTMPVLTHHQRDASPYITCAFVVAKDPETGIRGLGIHRIQVKGKDTLGIFLASPPMSSFLAKAEERDEPLEIAIVSGADPIMFFASPLSVSPGVDKYDIAGGLAESPIELVRGKSVDVEVPTHAQFVLEGFVIPRRREREGPLGESTGYYLTYDNPIAKIKVITHRKNPVYHALMPFGAESKTLLLTPMQIDAAVWLKSMVPSVCQAHCPAFGVIYVQIEKQKDEEVKAVIDALFSRTGTPYAKFVVVIDTDVDVSDPEDIAWALGSRVRPEKDIMIESDMPGFIIDPSTTDSEEMVELGRRITRTAKIGIDATKPLAERNKYEKIDVPPLVKLRVAKMIGM